MCVVEVDEMSLEGAGQGAIRLNRRHRVDVNGEVLTARIPGKRQRVTGDRTGELERIAVRPVERAGDGVVFLCEDEFQPEVFDLHRPGAGDRFLLGAD